MLLFFSNSGSYFSASWNQFSCCFHSKPFFANHSQIIESNKWTPWRFLNSVCNRYNVHSLNGKPRLSGFFSAKLINALRMFSGWVSGLPQRCSSFNPDKPSALNLCIHPCPDASLLYPACFPALAAERFFRSASMRSARLSAPFGLVLYASELTVPLPGIPFHLQRVLSFSSGIFASHG
jgi:hypothetical protein